MAPNIKNWAEVSFHSSRAGLYVLAGTAFLGSLLILGLRNGLASTDPSCTAVLKSSDEEF